MMTFADKLLSWFDINGRKDLPWQQNKTPYRVWVSEIMLQQTQVSTVIDYYQRFMDSFPTVDALAEAPEDKVLEHWSGLGYYARARNLHKTAKIVSHELDGLFPDSVDGLIELPGIGRSTAGAIISIAFEKYASILDGNVKRVLCRFYAIDTWSGERETEKKLWQLADTNTPEYRTNDYTQAIMDLGATLCKRSKPACDICPMLDDCQAYAQGKQTQLPISKPKKKIPLKETLVLVIEGAEGILLEKRPPTGIWGSLYSLPEANANFSDEEVIAHCTKSFGGHYELHERHVPFQHTFSHYKLEIKPVLLSEQKASLSIQEDTDYHWYPIDELNNIGLPAPIAKYLQRLYQASLLN